MTFDLDVKTVTSFVLGIVLVVIQAVQNYYADGLSHPLTWVYILATILGPTALVALANNTTWSPATKALVQSACAVAIVFLQGIEGVYTRGGVSVYDWLTIAFTTLTAFGVYFLGQSKTVPAVTTGTGPAVTSG